MFWCLDHRNGYPAVFLRQPALEDHPKAVAVLLVCPAPSDAVQLLLVKHEEAAVTRQRWVGHGSSSHVEVATGVCT